MRQKKPQIYTVTMAQLLMGWRISQGISRYEVAKNIRISGAFHIASLPCVLA